MTVHIVITGHQAGKTWLYEKVGRKGRKKLVPTYHANIEKPDGSLFWFAVTRDSARIVFGTETERFLFGGECPPSKQANPYFAKHQKAPRNGDCLLVFEDHRGEGYVLCGTESVERRSILIHAAPASSLGCFGVAGGTYGYKNFWRELCAVTDNFASESDIRVHVEPRPVSHHNRHLA